MLNLLSIKDFLEQMSCVSSAVVIDMQDTAQYVMVDITLPKLVDTLTFKLFFDPWYPAKVCGQESIHVCNEDLIEYPHIMEGGYLCLHTISSTDWQEKLTSDIEQICQWVNEYYINKKSDTHFEHLVVNESVVNDCYYSFNYAQTNRPFEKGEYGYVNYKSIMDGVKKGRVIKNYVVVNYHSGKNVNQTPSHASTFSDYYSDVRGCSMAPFIVLKQIPGKYDKFIYHNYNEFEGVITQHQRNHIREFAQYAKQRNISCQYFPLFIGYEIPNGDMAWNVAMIDKLDLPTEAEPEYKDGRKTGFWVSYFKNKRIDWAMTNDISPEYFFGRGCFPKSITNKRILIMGVGAIGSIVATTLVRGGCRSIGLYDIDNKEPGNVCRSDYDFICPTNDKMSDLSLKLQYISPYVNVVTFKERFDEFVKVASKQNSEIKESVRKAFKENFDLIIDCTTDDDVMYALEQLRLPIDVVNISISNHAENLVCAFSPSIYEFVRGVYQHTIKNDSVDLFFPTGCWNPTFKATYNDIASKLQYAIKKIVKMLSGVDSKQNFVIAEDSKGIHFQPW